MRLGSAADGLQFCRTAGQFERRGERRLERRDREALEDAVKVKAACEKIRRRQALRREHGPVGSAPHGRLAELEPGAAEGFAAMAGYVRLLAVLLGSMAFVALILNPFLVWICTRENPFPLVLLCLRESGVNAFFTRSSAANIPVNMEICSRMHLPKAVYSVSIPVGATINMAGAAVTITVITLSAAYSLGISVDLWTAVFLCVVSSVCAAGTSGVPGGSLMLIPLACGLFGIDQNTAMQVVAVGFIIGVLQDSCETGLNSSSDALFTIAACRRAERLAKAKL